MTDEVKLAYSANYIYRDGYDQGVKDTIDKIQDPSLRKMIVEDVTKLLNIYAKKGEWEALHNLAADFMTTTCRWNLADAIAKELERDINEGFRNS